MAVIQSDVALPAAPATAWRRRAWRSVRRHPTMPVGVVAGFTRWVDAIVMRIMDGLMSIPEVLIAIALMALTRASMGNVIFAITVAQVPRVTRLVRGIVLTLREQPYVEAAIASGTSFLRILWRHIVPNPLPPLLVQ